MAQTGFASSIPVPAERGLRIFQSRLTDSGAGQVFEMEGACFQFAWGMERGIVESFLRNALIITLRWVMFLSHGHVPEGALPRHPPAQYLTDSWRVVLITRASISEIFRGSESGND